MIIQFRFENFRSFRQSALIRLQATGSKSHPHHLAALPCGQILKNLAIYGPNASGKSQLINALHPPSFQPASGVCHSLKCYSDPEPAYRIYIPRSGALPSAADTFLSTDFLLKTRFLKRSSCWQTENLCIGKKKKNFISEKFSI